MTTKRAKTWDWWSAISKVERNNWILSELFHSDGLTHIAISINEMYCCGHSKQAAIDGLKLIDQEAGLLPGSIKVFHVSVLGKARGRGKPVQVF